MGEKRKRTSMSGQLKHVQLFTFLEVGVREGFSCLTENKIPSFAGIARTLAVRLKKPLGSIIFSTTLHLIPAVLSYSYTTPYSRWTLSTVRLTCSFFPSMMAMVLNLSITSGIKIILIQQIQEGFVNLFK